jgi:DNA repair exonuclease SbcCD ATPase subunit
MNISEIKEKLNKKETEFNILKKDLEKLKGTKKELFVKMENLEEARAIFQKASQVTQQRLSVQISDIVSKALSAVFPDPYKFVVEFERKRNVTECNLMFERNGKLKDPMESCGYGVADIASLALRVAFWKLEGKSRNTFFLDEPLRNLDQGKQALASRMIKKLSEIGIQFLVVTHQRELAVEADKVFKMKELGIVEEI